MTEGAPDIWNTWDADWPACAVHLGSGAVLRAGAYSASANTFTDFPWSPAHRLGTHHLDGGEIELELTHAGSTVRLELAAAGDGCVTGRVSCTDMAEWGLRFWLLLEFGTDETGDPAAVRLITPPGREYLEPPVALLDRGAERPSAAFGTLDRPGDARLTMERGVLGTLMESQSYYARPPQPERGRYAVFRFSAADPVTAFAAAAGPDAAAAQDRLRRVLAAGGARGVSARGSGNRAAVRDVLGWNTVWDPVGRQVYTVATRAWIARKFGGFGVWQIDGFLHSILAAHLGAGRLAWDNVAAVLAGRTPRGNLTALRAATTNWADRSHPPVGAQACWSVQAMTPDGEAAARAAEVLARAFDWWFATRDGNGNGLLEYGSSPVGDGHFVHTRQAAMDESANDNSPVHDDARFDESTHTLDLEDVGLNSLLVHEGSLLARLLPDPGTAGQIADRAAELAEAVRTRLWDDGREVFAGRLWSGKFTRSLSPTSFYPLLAGIATPGQAEAMVQRWLADPRRFGGPYPVAGTPHSDPAALDSVYWRGRVWPCFNYLVYLGLRRYRFDEQAAWLAARGLEMFRRGWAERRCHENFSQQTGDGGDSVDAEPFYTWGALLPMIADLEVIGTDPWDGTCFGCAGEDSRSAVGYVAGLPYSVELGPQTTSLSRDGVPLLRAGLRGRFRQLSADETGLSVELPPAAHGDVTVELAVAGPGAVVTLDGTPAPESRLGPLRRTGEGRGWLPVRIPVSPRPRRLEVTRPRPEA